MVEFIPNSPFRGRPCKFGVKEARKLDGEGRNAFRGIWSIYIHSNVWLLIGPLRWFIGAPELHHWHHDRACDAGNYANISPLMGKRPQIDPLPDSR